MPAPILLPRSSIVRSSGVVIAPRRRDGLCCAERGFPQKPGARLPLHLRRRHRHRPCRTCGGPREAAEQARRAERKADDLRDIVEAWVAWGRRIHDEWPTLRLRDDPPAFPRVADLDLDSSQPMRPRRR